MPRFNPYTLDRPAAVVETREFVDPSYPDQPLELTLRAVREAPFKFKIQSKIDEYVTDYVLGRPTGKMPKKGELPKRFPPTPVFSRSAQGKQRIDVDEQTCKFVAVIEMMQVPGDGDAPYDFGELLQMAVVIPDAFVEAGLWAFGLLNGADDDDDASEPAPNP